MTIILYTIALACLVFTASATPGVIRKHRFDKQLAKAVASFARAAVSARVAFEMFNELMTSLAFATRRWADELAEIYEVDKEGTR